MVVAQYGAPEGEWEPFELCRSSVPGKEGPKRSSEAEDISIFRDNWAQETGKGWGVGAWAGRGHHVGSGEPQEAVHLYPKAERSC